MAFCWRVSRFRRTLKRPRRSDAIGRAHTHIHFSLFSIIIIKSSSPRYCAARSRCYLHRCCWCCCRARGYCATPLYDTYFLKHSARGQSHSCRRHNFFIINLLLFFETGSSPTYNKKLLLRLLRSQRVSERETTPLSVCA